MVDQGPQSIISSWQIHVVQDFHGLKSAFTQELKRGKERRRCCSAIFVSTAIKPLARSPYSWPEKRAISAAAATAPASKILTWLLEQSERSKIGTTAYGVRRSYFDVTKARKPRLSEKASDSEKEKEKNLDNGKRKRSSFFRGITRHRWTGRYEAHLWDKNPLQNKKGRQGAYDDEDAAARAYDLAALKYCGPETALNFPFDTYIKDYEEMQRMSKEEYVASLRRRSNGFSRGVSKYRGVARIKFKMLESCTTKKGRWEARIGVFGNKNRYLGTFSSQEDAARAYDRAAIQFRGPNAVTNFDISNYMNCQKVPATATNTPEAPPPEVNQDYYDSEEANAAAILMSLRTAMAVEKIG
ncbi:hypothetical protein ZIOFF_025711 [Zingiber officinale]|uniref:AP2/ERF domain-containing protein n=1 Tax=Zingiber officinale TaxID=94328 RepID=A0A8J5HC82_ZINOF|nr:hypothetical protein ZIOFF_025711 [Zingiber officinale]